jgi:cytochrome c oxidase subunit 4
VEQVETPTTPEHEVVTTPPRAAGRWARHPSPKEYIRIAIVLAVVTAAEVAVYYIDWIHENDLLIPLLFLFAIVKFSLVVMWFMHLRFDSRTYARFFLLGIAGAFTLYVAVLLMFRTFA